jgi:hypothetical protein
LGRNQPTIQGWQCVNCKLNVHKSCRDKAAASFVCSGAAPIGQSHTGMHSFKDFNGVHAPASCVSCNSMIIGLKKHGLKCTNVRTPPCAYVYLHMCGFALAQSLASHTSRICKCAWLYACLFALLFARLSVWLFGWLEFSLKARGLANQSTNQSINQAIPIRQSTNQYVN